MSELKVIDCDVHPYMPSVHDCFPYLSEAWRQRFGASEFRLSARAPERYMHPGSTLRADATPPGGGLPGSDPAYTAAHLLDAWDVEVALLLPLQPAAVSAWTDPVGARAFTAAANDFFLDHWIAADPRYRPAVTVSPLDPARAAQEIRRQAERDGVLAVQLPLLGILMGNLHYHPIYEAAAEAELPIVVHPTGSEGCYLGAPPLAGGVPRTYAERHALLGQVAQSNLVSLLFEGVFERFPALKVMFVEYGFSWALTTMWRMDKEWSNFRFDTPWLRRRPSEYLLDHVRFSTQPVDEPADPAHLVAVMQMMSAERTLCFASDYPHYDNDNPKLALGTVPEPLRSSIAGGVARETFSASRLGGVPVA